MKTQETSVQRLIIEGEYAGQRLDNFLFTHLKSVPKTHIYRILRRGEVRINKGRVKPSYRLMGGEELRLPPIRSRLAEAPKLGAQTVGRVLLDCVLYEDEHLLIINKPSGWAVHGGSGISLGVVEALRLSHPVGQSLELVHRIDRETSGCLVLAKRRSTLRALHQAWRANAVDKSYLALLQGTLAQAETSTVSLQKNILSSGERVVRAHPSGQPACTEFVPRQQFQGATLVQALPITGRTHQIRVHSACLEHPIAGDEKYGNNLFNRRLKDLGLNRLFLHAEQLAFELNDKKIRVKAPLPDELQNLLDRLSLGELND